MIIRLILCFGAYNLLHALEETTYSGRYNEPLNPGRPLEERDFFLGKQMQLRSKIQNETTDRMMLSPKWRSQEMSMEELELLGDKHVKDVIAKQGKNALAAVSYHWPNGIMYYTIDAAFTDSERSVIAAGMAHVEENSCIRFVPRTNQVDYVDIIPGNGGCYAVIPYRTGDGRMEIGLQQDGCVYLKVVVHELLHSLGFKHEQNRPDRDSHISMVWSNIKNDGASQFFIDAWDGTTSTLPKCDTNGNSDGTDYSNCYSVWYTDACNLGYDYTSIMHYSLYSFALNSQQPVMIPTDTSITSTGNTVLSALDIQKIQCLYYCDGTNNGTCGGHLYGESGVIESEGAKTCKWLLRVDDGYAIKLSFESFGVQCADGSFKIYDGDDTTGTESTYCMNSDPAPGVIMSSDSTLYIVYSTTGPTNGFKATWEKVPIVCCATATLSSTADDFNNFYESFFSGTWTYTAGDDINNRPIYRKGSYAFAVATVSTGFIPFWVLTSTPGSNSGFVFEENAKPQNVLMLFQLGNTFLSLQGSKRVTLHRNWSVEPLVSQQLQPLLPDQLLTMMGPQNLLVLLP